MTLAADSTNIVAADGAITSFPTTATGPTGTDTVLPTGSVNHGLTDSDGVVFTADVSTTNITAWQGSQTVRTIVTESNETVKFKLITPNPENLSLYFGASANGDGSWTINPGKTHARRSYVFDAIDEGSGNHVRVYLYSAAVTAVGDLPFVSNGLIVLDITLTAYKVGDGVGKIWVDTID